MSEQKTETYTEFLKKKVIKDKLFKIAEFDWFIHGLWDKDESEPAPVKHLMKDGVKV